MPGRLVLLVAIVSLALLMVGCSASDAAATPTPYPAYELDEAQLELIPLGPGDLPEGSPTLRVGAGSGVHSNADLADNTFALSDTADTWAQAGRVTGYLIELESFEPGPLFLQVLVDHYADTRSARDGFLILARDLWETDGQLAEGLVFEDVRERPVPGIGDQALFQGGRVRFEGAPSAVTDSATFESVAFRLGNLIAVVQIVRFEGASDALDLDAIVALLEDRITAVVSGTATWGAVAIPASDDPRPTGGGTRGVPAASTPAAELGSGCAGDGPRVCLVPLGGYAAPPVDALVRHLLDRGVPAGSVPPVGLDFRAVDPARQQFGAIAATARVAAAYPDLATDPQVTLIALTEEDIFVKDGSFAWVFGMRGGEALIISTARMDERTWGSPQDDGLRDARLRKMLLRYVGLFHLGLPENDSPLTVLYRNLDGLTELDAMIEGVLQERDLPEPSNELATWARSFCSLAESTFVRWVDGSDQFAFATSGSPTLEVYRQATLEYLDVLWQSGQDFWGQTSRLTLPDRADELGIVALNESIRLYAAWDTSLYNSIVPRVHAANTTGELAGLMVELAVDVSEDPALYVVDQAYASLHLSVSVALRQASPCGQFGDGGFSGAQVA